MIRHNMLRKLRARLGLTLLLIGAPIMDDNGLPFVFDHMAFQGRLVGNADEVGNALLKSEVQQINAARRRKWLSSRTTTTCCCARRRARRAQSATC